MQSAEKGFFRVRTNVVSVFSGAFVSVYIYQNSLACALLKGVYFIACKPYLF